jgi:hypothetical protein
MRFHACADKDVGNSMRRGWMEPAFRGRGMPPVMQKGATFVAPFFSPLKTVEAIQK